VTDEQFKTWAVDFFDRIETIHSWREAATEAIKMIENERAKNAKLVEALINITNEKTDTAGAYKMRTLKIAGDALAKHLKLEC
jgi:hypothetical protein